MHIPDIEQLSLQDQHSHQATQLQQMLVYLAAHSPFYQKQFAQHGVVISDIRTIKDLEQLPTTDKQDLQLHNWDFLCVPRTEIREYTATSGTMGAPVTIALTENDLKRLAYNEYISFVCAGGREGDIYQLMLTLDRQFMAGMAYYAGIKELKAAAVRTGPGLPAMQWDTIKRLGSNTLVAVPSFLLKLIEHAETYNIPLAEMPVKKAVCIGENLRGEDFALNALGQKIKEHWNIELYSTYASTEMQTAFTECWKGAGGHHHPELIIVEILDDNGKQLPAGQYGEVTITSLGVEGMPLLRYRTGDICAYYDEPCACGRKTVRLSPVKGRKQQMIKYKGTTLYPPALFDLLNESKVVKDYVVEVYSSELETDELLLHIHTQLPVDDCEKVLKPFLQSRIRVIPHIQYVSGAEILLMQFPENSRKAVKFIDKRK